MKAEKLRPYSEGTETIAIALVINGQMIWIGSDEIPDLDDNSKYPGVLKNLEQAIDKLQLGNAGPPGSKGMVVSYSNGAEVKVPMGDLKLITGGALGEQKDYKNKIGTDMVQGITMAMAELSKVSTARKALIVVGDGNDTNNEAAKGALADLKKQATKQGVTLFAIIYKDPISSEGAVITTMIPNAKTVNRSTASRRSSTRSSRAWPSATTCRSRGTTRRRASTCRGTARSTTSCSGSIRPTPTR